MRHLIPISGKDSLATALLQTAYRPDLPYEYLFTDTGAELPETYEWLDRVEAKTGFNINRVGKNLEDTISGFGSFLPSVNGRYCTRICKIEPMEQMYKEETTVYYGLRADENRTGYVPLGKSNIIPAYPLRDFNIDLRGVYSILQAQDLMPPDFFWQRLYDRVKILMGGGQYIGLLDALTITENRILFAGRSRGNCFFCFFQRKYEWVWLLEAHTELYQRASDLEKPDYTWVKNTRLSELAKDTYRLNKIFNDRAKEVYKYIMNKQQMRIGIDGGVEADNEIALTSCGLLCGK